MRSILGRVGVWRRDSLSLRLVAVAVGIAVSTSTGQTFQKAPAAPPSRNGSDNVKRIRGFVLGGIRIDFETTTLATVIARSGRGHITRGNGENSDLRQLCYATGTERQARFVTLESSPIGGSEAAITGATIGTGDRPASCEVLTDTTLMIDRNVELGLSVTALRRRLRDRGHWSGANELTFAGSYPCETDDGRKDTQAPRGCSTYAGIRAVMKKSRVTRLYIWQVTTV